MGWVIMSERELNRIEVLAQIDDGKLSVEAGANMLGLTRRQVFRLLKTYRTDGAAAIRHQARGRAPNNRIHKAKRDYALALVKENYVEFGPTLGAEMLAEHHGFKVSRETLRKWMVEDGLWLSRKQRRTFHQPRLRRECYGELIQIDGSDHRWFEDRGPPCTLLVFIDDATSTLMELRFVPSESTFSYFEALESYLGQHGRPVALYSDKHSVFRIAKPNDKLNGMTQFGRALAELSIEILCANSSQAKGRVERANRTLQDRLVKELRLAGICDMDAGNAFLPGFMERYNAQFAKSPAKPDNLHRALNIEPDRLNEVFCLRDKRYVTKDLSLKYDRKRSAIVSSEISATTRRKCRVPFGMTCPNSNKYDQIELMSSVLCLTIFSRKRNKTALACWASVLGSTKRMFGLNKASTIASASAASFFCRLTKFRDHLCAEITL